MNKIYSLNLKILIISAVVIFIVGIGFGMTGNSTPKENPKEQQKIMDLSFDKQVLSQQVKDCHEVIEKDRQVIIISSEVISISGNALTAVMNEDIVAIDKATDEIDDAVARMTELKNEITPLAEKCFKEN